MTASGESIEPVSLIFFPITASSVLGALKDGDDLNILFS
jgi:hypothetical protein